MPRENTQADRDSARIKVLSQQLREAHQRNYEYREEVDDLQERISRLHAQQLIHPTDRPGEGS